MLSSLIGEGLVGNWRERGAIGAVGKVGLPLGDGVVGLGNGVFGLGNGVVGLGNGVVGLGNGFAGLGNGVVGKAAWFCDLEKGVVGN